MSRMCSPCPFSLPDCAFQYVPLSVGGATMARSSAIPRVLLACVVTLVACDRVRDPVRPTHIEPTLAIFDGAHGGNLRFYFLPPLAAAFPYVGIFDPYMTPEVR